LLPEDVRRTGFLEVQALAAAGKAALVQRWVGGLLARQQ